MAVELNYFNDNYVISCLENIAYFMSHGSNNVYLRLEIITIFVDFFFSHFTKEVVH